ncbi:MAG: HD domain-containing protein [Candidatus Riflebacteria bacterium]|nr:HD domain-containing protein [Candidatus Riflebacteria bacterium]
MPSFDQHSQALQEENARLRNQVLELSQLDDAGFFTETDSILGNILKRARILTMAETAFFALPSIHQGKLDLKIVPPDYENAARKACNEFEKNYEQWETSESELLTSGKFVILPFTRRHKLIGVMGLKLTRNAPENVCELLTGFVKQASVTLENTLFHEKSFKRLLTLSNFSNFTRASSVDGNLEKLVEEFLTLTRETISSEFSIINLSAEANGGTPINRILTDTGLSDLFSFSSLFEADVEKVIETQNYLLSELPFNKSFSKNHLQEKSNKSPMKVLSVPILAEQKMFGVLQLIGKKSESPFSQEDIEQAKLLCEQFASHIDSTSRFKEIKKAFLQSATAFADILESRDSFFRGHSRRVVDLSMKLAEILLPDRCQKENLEYASIIHETGKYLLPLELLHKPSSLSSDEFEIIKTHIELVQNAFENVTYLQKALKIARHHHERFDGRGYPDGLKGEDIPYSSRMLAITDAFDAMISIRPHRTPLSETAALQEILRSSGSHFDPEIVKVFVNMRDPSLIKP